MGKATITQRSFALGEVREEFLEAKDLDLRLASLKGGLNARIKATRTLASRPGTFHVREGSGATDMIELRPETGVIVSLKIRQSSFEIMNEAGQILFTSAGFWTNPEEVWIEPFRKITVMGSPEGIYTLTYEGGVWTLAAYAFEESSGGELAQPYWVFVKTLTMRPSGTSGAIEITASGAFFTDAYIGLRMRYGRREILIDGVSSPTVATGVVTNTLYKSYRITVADGSTFRVGDAVVGQDTGYEGLITAINVNDLDCATLEFDDGPDDGEGLSGPRGSSDVTAKVEIPPVASPIWDEPLMSVVRGFPRAGASAAGRLTLVDFPLVPDLIAMSSTRDIADFEVGADDDDAIVRQAGDNAPRFRHVVNAGDLLLLSDRGLYYIDIRNGGLLTPSTFNAILFDRRSANEVRPVALDDGVIFVEASGEAIAAAQLLGNVNLKWSARTISTYHNHLIKTPVKLCGPSLFSENPEKYLFVVNTDGTLAVMSWFEDFSPENVGFLPWATDGSFISLSPMFGGYWAIVDRDVGGVTTRFVERFSDDAKMDCCCTLGGPITLTLNGSTFTANGVAVTAYGATPLPLVGATVEIYGSGFWGGERVVGADGVVPDTDDMPVGSVCGFPFDTVIQPWPQEHVETPYAGMLKARTIRGSVAVMHTGPFEIRANANTRQIGGYDVGDLLDTAPALQTKVVKFLVFGRRDYPEIEISRRQPGDFQILAITHEVQY